MMKPQQTFDPPRLERVGQTRAAGIILAVLAVLVLGVASVDDYLLFHAVAEIFSAVVAAAIFLIVWRHRADFDRPIYLFIVASIVGTILSELAFTHYLSPYGFANILGHFLKIVSFYLIYRALVQEVLKRPYSLLFRDLEQAKTRLEEAKDELEARVRERTAELSESRERILADQATLAALTEELLMTEEREKRRIATGLHDGIGQILAFAKREIGGLEKTALPDQKGRLVELRGQIDIAIKQTRDLTSDLSPSSLYSFGLEAALEELAAEFSRQGMCACHVHKEGRPLELSDQLKILLYRFVHELLVNATRHAHAKNVHIHLLGHEGTATVQVEDDGEGFDLSSLQTGRGHTEGFGLLGIRERLTHLGGEFTIESAPGKGTEIRLTVPAHPDKPLERTP